jgi:hypothetical protein
LGVFVSGGAEFQRFDIHGRLMAIEPAMGTGRWNLIDTNPIYAIEP